MIYNILKVMIKQIIKERKFYLKKNNKVTLFKIKGIFVLFLFILGYFYNYSRELGASVHRFFSI